MQLRTKLTGIYGAVLGGVLVALLVLDWLAIRELKKSAENSLLETATRLAQDAERGSGYKLKKLEALASMAPVVRAVVHADKTSLDELSIRLKELVRYEGGRSVFLLNSEGTCIASDVFEELYQLRSENVFGPFSCVQRAWAGEATFGSPLISELTGRPMLPLAVPVRAGETIVGVLWCSLDMGVLERYMFSVNSRTASNFYGLSYLELEPRKTILIPDSNPLWRERPLLIAQALEVAPGGIRHSTENELLLASARIFNSSWVAVATLPVDEVLTPIYKLQSIVIAIVFILVGLLLGITLRFLSPIVRGIEACRRFADQIREGRLERRLSFKPTRDEIEALSCGLNSMAIELENSRNIRELLSESELHMLRFQLNPHFLFNAFNSIHVLMNHDPEKAQIMLQRLADFCRTTLMVPDSGQTSVRSEIERLKQYLDIERMRWSDKLKIEIEMDKDIALSSIPIFSLQLLVENAIKYGQQSGAIPLKIKIHAYENNNRLILEVSNTGRWFVPVNGPESTGTGLTNLKARLHHFYGSDARIEHSEVDGHVTVCVNLPRKPVSTLDL